MNDERKHGFRQFLRSQCLRTIFVPSVSWLALLVMADAMESIRWSRYIPEDGRLHAVMEAGAPWFPVLPAFALSLWVLHRRPRFLALSEAASLPRVLMALALRAAALFLPFVIGTVVICYLFYDPATDPQGQFHIWVWGAGLLYAAAFSPVTGLVWTWFVLRDTASVP